MKDKVEYDMSAIPLTDQEATKIVKEMFQHIKTTKERCPLQRTDDGLFFFIWKNYQISMHPATRPGEGVTGKYMATIKSV